MSCSLAASRRRGNRRASSRFAGDMRACCGAPAARGSPPRPGSLGWWGLSRFVLRPAGSTSLITNTVFPAQCTESTKESRFSGSTARDAVALAKKEQQFRFVDVSVAGRGGDRRPTGAEAPTPDGRSSRVGAGQREAERPLPRGREEANGTPRVSVVSARDDCPNAGLGVVGGFFLLFSSLDYGYCPASGPGRLPAGGRG